METYADILDLRNRGVTEETATDGELEVALARGTLLVEAFCGRIFFLTTKTILIDGNGKETLFLEERPVVRVRKLWVDDVEVLADSFRVYTEEGYIRLNGGTHFPWSLVVGVFPRGAQNVKVRADFGYEVVPEDVKEACIILALKEIKGLRDEAGAAGSILETGAEIRRVKVDDLSVDFETSGGTSKRAGLLGSTGDLKADRLLSKYRVRFHATTV